MTISLDELSRSPEQAAKLPARERRQVVLKCSAIIASAASFEDEEVESDLPDRWISAQDVADALGLSLSWVKHAHLPFRVKAAGKARYSAQGLERYMRMSAKP